MKHHKHPLQWAISLLCLLFLIALIAGESLAQESEQSEKEALFERLQLLSYEERVAAPDFSLPDIHGGTITLSELQGKVIFLNFWTTW